MVNYVYDAWGQVSLGGTPWNWVALGELNPFRYRGYYYDTESGLYYLNSRYYDPEIGRYINADGYISTGQGIISNNMFSYCGNNPIMRADPSGRFWEELWQAFSQAINQTKEIFALAGVVSQADSPAPGPADVAAGIIAVGTLIYCGAVAVSQAIAATSSPSVSLPKEEEKGITAPPPSTSTKIYRYGGTNPGNLTPKAKDRYTGLSFSTIPMPGAAVTTIEALNSTGVVYAVKDGVTHVSVRPVSGTMEDWINAGSSSIWTQAVKSVVIKWDGVS